MAKGRFKSIESVCARVKKDLDTPNPEKLDHTKLMVLFACNTSGKTRLSKIFSDKYKEQVLFYNAYIEDLFSWDNESYILKIDSNAPIFRALKDQGLDRRVIANFQELTGSKLEPDIDLPNNKISFGIQKGDSEGSTNIKISRSEESILIWSIFYTVLDAVVDALNEKNEDEAETDFDNIQYIVIDDPVSSMDDTRIITVALELAKLIKKSKNQLKFLITTHHALFFNVLFNVRGKNWDRKNYILSKSGAEFLLKGQGSESPFAYHHVAMADIEKAIKDEDIKKYHFNIFRALLEKTANFLGYDSWKMCLKGSGHSDAFAKIIDHYSHDRLSDLEYRDITNDEKAEFVEAFNFFTDKYFKQEVTTNG